MFRVDLNLNRISRLPQKRFGDLALRERQHLQEWLVHQPDALGEDLLILQKEFDGFDETRERLDLLALDKAGNLVVIENKLDDSGRDVTWQAIKYAAYVSSLKKTQVVDIFQQYLDRHCDGGNAAQLICEFLAIETMDDAVLNPGSGQRIMFVAANFRREVTATALWLIGRGIAVQCFRVTPFAFEDELFLDLQQIIPPPEAADYMIGISSKEVEETASIATQSRRHDIRYRFWSLALQKLAAGNVKLFGNISPGRENWIAAGSGLAGCQFALAFTQTEARVELNFVRKSQAENKKLFDLLFARRSEIEQALGSPLNWQRKDDQVQCKIISSRPFNGFDETEWESMAQWMVDGARRFELAFRERMADLSRQVLTDDESIE